MHEIQELINQIEEGVKYVSISKVDDDIENAKSFDWFCKTLLILIIYRDNL